ncbi:uncharacterized protein ACNLHF_025151 isoform 1-T3 [Anomaloglossus baeobatrachus]|uniref:uncharacterized protein LOC142246475 n=1 Tax=Anomaloglossus baeobatrachus TaxID=238106 RepID=UPI003F4FEC6C
MDDQCSHLYEQLVILFHSHGCAECKEEGSVLQYSAIPTCHSVDVVLSHMKYCQAGMSCQIPGCSFARVIVSHVKTCKRQMCPVVRNFSEDRKQRVRVHLQAAVVTFFESLETPCKILFKQLILIFRNHQCEMCKTKHCKVGVPSCHSVDAELSHMKYCMAGMSCRFPGCAASRSIISHWKICRQEDCLVVWRLRKDRKPVKKKLRLDLLFPFSLRYGREVTKYYRQSLFVMFHAWNCINRQTSTGKFDCDLRRCQTMQFVLQHVESCEDGSRCKFPMCCKTRFLFIHYMSCLLYDCEICWPLRSEIMQLGGMTELLTTRSPWRLWEDFPSADILNPNNERPPWFSSHVYKWIRTQDEPLIGPPLFQRREEA